MKETVPSEQAVTRRERPLPPRVQEALGELVGVAQEGLLALSVGVGLGVLAELMEEEVTEVVGPKGRHDPERRTVRHGHEAGEVTLGGRRVGVELTCGHDWSPQGRQVKQGKVCPKCGGKLPVPQDEWDRRAAAAGLEWLETVSGAMTPTPARCLKCNHEWRESSGLPSRSYGYALHTGASLGPAMAPLGHLAPRQFTPPSCALVRVALVRVALVRFA